MNGAMDAGSVLVRLGLLVGVLLVLRMLALHWVPLEAQPLVCRRKVARRAWMVRPLVVLAALSCVAGAVLLLSA